MKTAITTAAAASTLLILLSASTAQSEKLTLDYSVKAGGEKIGWSKAVVDETTKGKVVSVTMKITAEIFGKVMTMTTSMKNRYDIEGHTASFVSKHDSPKGEFEITGKRLANGSYKVTRSSETESETSTVSADSFDTLTSDPAIYSGPVGKKKKLKLLFTASGKVRKVTVKVLDRSTQTFLGKEVTVTHFKVSGSKGGTEEWRTDDGTLIRSNIKTPMGKIVVKLIPPKS